MHGTAGTAPLAILALATLPSPDSAWLMLSAFGVGTLGTMATVSIGLAMPLRRLASCEHLRSWATAGTGAISVSFGLYLVVGVGLGHGIL